MGAHSYCDNKIIYLIAPPRTCSTVFLRAMEARDDDMTVFNEPSQYALLAKHKPSALAETFEITPSFESYEKVKQTLLEASKEADVFVKDPCCAAYESLYEDDAFLLNENVHFCFLIRHPHPSLISYYKACGNKISTSGLDWVVYERLYLLFEKITKLRKKSPIVISGEDLTKNPSVIMRLFCDKIGIAFKDADLQWPSLEEAFDPSQWNDPKNKASCEKWHGNAIKSTCFLPHNPKYSLDQEGLPTFAEAEEADREKLKRVYSYYMEFYSKMSTCRLTDQ